MDGPPPPRGPPRPPPPPGLPHFEFDPSRPHVAPPGRWHGSAVPGGRGGSGGAEGFEEPARPFPDAAGSHGSALGPPRDSRFAPVLPGQYPVAPRPVSPSAPRRWPPADHDDGRGRSGDVGGPRREHSHSPGRTPPTQPTSPIEGPGPLRPAGGPLPGGGAAEAPPPSPSSAPWRAGVPATSVGSVPAAIHGPSGPRAPQPWVPRHLRVAEARSPTAPAPGPTENSLAVTSSPTTGSAPSSPSSAAPSAPRSAAPVAVSRKDWILQRAPTGLPSAHPPSTAHGAASRAQPSVVPRLDALTPLGLGGAAPLDSLSDEALPARDAVVDANNRVVAALEEVQARLPKALADHARAAAAAAALEAHVAPLRAEVDQLRRAEGAIEEESSALRLRRLRRLTDEARLRRRHDLAPRRTSTPSKVDVAITSEVGEAGDAAAGEGVEGEGASDGASSEAGTPSSHRAQVLLRLAGRSWTLAANPTLPSLWRENRASAVVAAALSRVIPAAVSASDAPSPLSPSFRRILRQLHPQPLPTSSPGPRAIDDEELKATSQGKEMEEEKEKEDDGVSLDALAARALQVALRADGVVDAKASADPSLPASGPSCAPRSFVFIHSETPSTSSTTTAPPTAQVLLANAFRLERDGRRIVCDSSALEAAWASQADKNRAPRSRAVVSSAWARPPRRLTVTDDRHRRLVAAVRACQARRRAIEAAWERTRTLVFRLARNRWQLLYRAWDEQREQALRRGIGVELAFGVEFADSFAQHTQGGGSSGGAADRPAASPSSANQRDRSRGSDANSGSTSSTRGGGASGGGAGGGGGAGNDASVGGGGGGATGGGAAPSGRGPSIWSSVTAAAALLQKPRLDVDARLLDMSVRLGISVPLFKAEGGTSLTVGVPRVPGRDADPALSALRTGRWTNRLTWETAERSGSAGSGAALLASNAAARPDGLWRAPRPGPSSTMTTMPPGAFAGSMMTPATVSPGSALIVSPSLQGPPSSSSSSSSSTSLAMATSPLMLSRAAGTALSSMVGGGVGPLASAASLVTGVPSVAAASNPSLSSLTSLGASSSSHVDRFGDLLQSAVKSGAVGGISARALRAASRKTRRGGSGGSGGGHDDEFDADDDDGLAEAAADLVTAADRALRTGASTSGGVGGGGGGGGGSGGGGVLDGELGFHSFGAVWGGDGDASGGAGSPFGSGSFAGSGYASVGAGSAALSSTHTSSAESDYALHWAWTMGASSSWEIDRQLAVMAEEEKRETTRREMAAHPPETLPHPRARDEFRLRVDARRRVEVMVREDDLEGVHSQAKTIEATPEVKTTSSGREVHLNCWFGFDDAAVAAEAATEFGALGEDGMLRSWSDVEKLIFFDRFLQFPKDFKRIATFLPRKSVRECVAFYYEAKYAAKLKHLLKRQMAALRRREHHVGWHLACQAARNIGVRVPRELEEVGRKTLGEPGEATTTGVTSGKGGDGNAQTPNGTNESGAVAGDGGKRIEDDAAVASSTTISTLTTAGSSTGSRHSVWSVTKFISDTSFSPLVRCHGPYGRLVQDIAESILEDVSATNEVEITHSEATRSGSSDPLAASSAPADLADNARRTDAGTSAPRRSALAGLVLRHLPVAPALQSAAYLIGSGSISVVPPSLAPWADTGAPLTAEESAREPTVSGERSATEENKGTGEEETATASALSNKATTETTTTTIPPPLRSSPSPVTRWASWWSPRDDADCVQRLASILRPTLVCTRLGVDASLWQSHHAAYLFRTFGREPNYVTGLGLYDPAAFAHLGSSVVSSSTPPVSSTSSNATPPSSPEDLWRVLGVLRPTPDPSVSSHTARNPALASSPHAMLAHTTQGLMAMGGLPAGAMYGLVGGGGSGVHFAGPSPHETAGGGSAQLGRGGAGGNGRAVGLTIAANHGGPGMVGGTPMTSSTPTPVAAGSRGGVGGPGPGGAGARRGMGAAVGGGAGTPVASPSNRGGGGHRGSGAAVVATTPVAGVGDAEVPRRGGKGAVAAAAGSPVVAGSGKGVSGAAPRALPTIIPRRAMGTVTTAMTTATMPSSPSAASPVARSPEVPLIKRRRADGDTGSASASTEKEKAIGGGEEAREGALRTAAARDEVATTATDAANLEVVGAGESGRGDDAPRAAVVVGSSRISLVPFSPTAP